MATPVNDRCPKPPVLIRYPRNSLSAAQSRYASSNPLYGSRLSPILASGSGLAPSSSSRNANPPEMFTMYCQQQKEITAAIEYVAAAAREANQQVKAFDELVVESKPLHLPTFEGY